jgi:UDP-N-acetylglucosamine 2-epimerase (non-hydrolysing)
MLLLGTRPEAVKLAPVALAAREASDVEVRLVSSGQHPEAMLEVLHHFGLDVQADLRLFHPGQTPAEVMSAAVKGFASEIEAWRPHFVLVQGDTTSALSGALAAFYGRVAVAHVEAGLRSHDLQRPFPEEMNRRAIDAFADVLFAPTPGAELNLLDEGADGRRVFVTGNTVVDSVVSVLGSQDVPSGIRDPAKGLSQNGHGNGNGNGHPYSNGNGNGHMDDQSRWRGRVLVTAHRRESWGAGLDEIAAALDLAARRFPDRQFLVPLHPNPLVRRSFGHPFPQNVALVDPLPYRQFVRALASSELVVTDSGGVLEEATCLGVPTLVVRDRTERPEAVDTGIAAVVGLLHEDVGEAITSALSRPVIIPAALRNCVFGDGRAGERILAWIRWRAGLAERRPKAFRPPRQLPKIAALQRARALRIST